MRLKTVHLVGFVLALTIAFTMPLFAQISGSAHDFSGDAWSGGEICAPCHTPHNGDTTVSDAPLWNHEVTAVAAYTLYSSSTLNATPGQPGARSKLCLSCHDGTVALDSFGGATGSVNISTVGTPAGYANVTDDLSDDHPIAFTYDATLAGADGSLVNPAADGDADPNTVGAAAPYLPLFSGSLECASCHEVHNDSDNTSLLRVANAGSDLCLKCHNK